MPHPSLVAVLMCLMAACYEPKCKVYLQAYNEQNQLIRDQSVIKFYCLTNEEFMARNGADCRDTNNQQNCRAKNLLHQLKMYRSGNNQISPQQYHVFAVRYRGDSPQIVGYRFTNIRHSSDTIRLSCHFWTS